jgi:hypothetical protein
MSLEAYVYKEHTLGLLVNGNTLEVLHASTLRGASGTTCSGTIHVNQEHLRPANKQDFSYFRVQWHPDYSVVDD